MTMIRFSRSITQLNNNKDHENDNNDDDDDDKAVHLSIPSATDNI